MPTGRMIAFTMALMGCLLIMYKAIWYDQFSCPDGFLLRVRPVRGWEGQSRPAGRVPGRVPGGCPVEGRGASPPLPQATTRRVGLGCSQLYGNVTCTGPQALSPSRYIQVLSLEKLKEKVF